jgi:Arginine/lysine/ornithine decarboxylases
MDQNKTPLFDALKKYVNDRITPFHVPGHKQGRGLGELQDYLGRRVLEMDVNGMKDLDYINNPSGVILEAERLCATLMGADHAYFLVNGTTSGVQAMIMSTCEPGSEIIIPRNAHKSTIGGIILSGAVPVYIQPEINEELGMAMGITVDSLKRIINQHPHARAVFVINPTYYGVSSDLQEIVSIAHRHNMAVLVDEAHGAHMSFHEDLPITAMQAGADMSAVSFHKTAGSMTQSSVLLIKSRLVSPNWVKQVLNLSYTSSASYILMCSLDVARKQLALRGRAMLAYTLNLARWVRNEINKIEPLYCFGQELTGTPGCHNFDETKVGIHVRPLGFTGYEIEEKLRDEFNIQMELSDLYNTLAIFSLGDIEEHAVRLVSAFRDITHKTPNRTFKNSTRVVHNPAMIVSPRDAFYSPKKIMPLSQCAGEIAGEMIMAYPPGIPVICMGERITPDIIKYVQRLKQESCHIEGPIDPEVNYLQILGS